MAVDFETLKTRPTYHGPDYLSMLRRLLPRGPIWGFTQKMAGELLPPGVSVSDKTGKPNALHRLRKRAAFSDDSESTAPPSC